LEITAFVGPTGTGRVLVDRELESALFRHVDEFAKMGRDGRGTIEIAVHGKEQTVGLQWYDSFGETCFRLFLDPNAEVEMTDDDDDELFDQVGECAGCEAYGPVDFQGLSNECGAKFERDLIRQNEWDYTTIGFVLPESERAAYRAKMIAEYGAEMELIAVERQAARKKPQSKLNQQRKQKLKRKNKRTRKRRKQK
jgi:hypothetical protein